MRKLQGAMKHYDWGSTDAIYDILRLPATDQPLAEYWLGTHPGGCATLDGQSLDEAIIRGDVALGSSTRSVFGDRLPFMIKLLSAAHPLSLQAHPNREEARVGFERENERGIELSAPDRTFKDPWDKPELLVALTEFDALAGFRDPAITLALFEQLGCAHALESLISPLRFRQSQAGLAQVFLDCLILDEDRYDLLTCVVAAAINHVNDDSLLGDFARTAVMLDEHFPNDPSLLAALLLNRQHLQPGQAIHIRPGTMHAYLQGTGVEILGNSDNVLRGGLTKKHIDPSALVEVVDFTPGPAPRLDPTSQASGLWHYDAQEESFSLWRLELIPGRVIDAPHESSGRIVMVTSGEIGLSTGMDGLMLSQGEACFIDAHDQVRISGYGQAFLAGAGLDLHLQ